MVRTRIFPLVACAAALTLSACSPSAQERCATASNPAECMSWADSGGDVQDYLIGGMAGYMLANRGGQQVIVQNPSYHGPYRRLRSPIMSESRQVANLKAKVEHQRLELKRQQAANYAKKAEIKAMKSSGGWGRSSWSTSSGRSSFRSSSFSSRRIGK